MVDGGKWTRSRTNIGIITNSRSQYVAGKTVIVDIPDAIARMGWVADSYNCGSYLTAVFIRYNYCVRTNSHRISGGHSTAGWTPGICVSAGSTCCRGCDGGSYSVITRKHR